MTHPADFLNAPFPDVIDLPDAIDGPMRYFNRELSWLAFNWRVLEEATNTKVPLLERVRFLSISATNLDEFYTVRVAGLRELARAGNKTPAADGLSPAEQLVLIEQNARALMAEQQIVLDGMKTEMASQDIHIVSADDLTDMDRTYVDERFIGDVFPILSPLAIDPAHPFPFIPNEGFALALQLEQIKGNVSLKALLPIPHQINRFLRLPGQSLRF